MSDHERRLWSDVKEIATADSRDVASRMFAVHVMRPLLGDDHVDAGVCVSVIHNPSFLVLKSKKVKVSPSIFHFYL